MTEEEIEEWFTSGLGATIKRFARHWEVTVFEESSLLEGEGEGDTMIEALSEAIDNYEYGEG